MGTNEILTKALAEETIAPTVDQHNSFKASCTLNEKEAGASDLQPMPNASKECHLFLTDLDNGGDVLVAIGRVYMHCVPTDTVHGIPLVINPWDDSVLYFNPLGNEPGDYFKELITLALKDWKTLVGRGIKKRHNYKTSIDTVHCPTQEGYVECSYFVLAFMREITLTVDGLASLQTKDFYTDADMSLVRQECATFVMRFIQY
ncbi:hypothetical protein TIFTF001_052211 [Ficus carica]|uniref:Ubiquitin-like protease family profile domain-containing protein n=1 Tax=Ficus carica TaxID=3494 RepID=A0AA88JIK3_FICCA|nr:hypothetical protein TIFTF001_052211 [Ficus carica]